MGANPTRRRTVATLGLTLVAAGLAGLLALFVNLGILRAAGEVSGPGRLPVGPVVLRVSAVQATPGPTGTPGPTATPSVHPTPTPAPSRTTGRDDGTAPQPPDRSFGPGGDD